VLVVDPAGKHWVKFSVKSVEPSPERPHGLTYALTLHDEKNDGFGPQRERGVIR
jgi:hypothetical protein